MQVIVPKPTEDLDLRSFRIEAWELAALKKAFNLARREWEWCHDNPVSRISLEKETTDGIGGSLQTKKNGCLKLRQPHLAGRGFGEAHRHCVQIKKRRAPHHSNQSDDSCSPCRQSQGALHSN
jgi:hypothetical protein